MSDDDIYIRVHDVTKCFGSQRIYKGLELSVRRGETLTVLGPSGTGKSVLLKLLMGLYKPERGTIVIDGADVVPMSERELREMRKKIGMLFQGAALFDSMTVGENVAYGLHEHFTWSDTKIKKRVAECLEWVGLPGVEERRPAELSGGMKKRVGLARALAPGPQLILYDEPTTGLDPSNTRRINELIVDLQKRLSVTSVVITHDMASALAVSNRIALLQQHRIDLVVEADLARRTPPPELECFMRGDEL